MICSPPSLVRATFLRESAGCINALNTDEMCVYRRGCLKPDSPESADAVDKVGFEPGRTLALDIVEQRRPGQAGSGSIGMGMSFASLRRF
jgi:hypothetical protein